MRISDWSSDVCSSDLFGDKRASAGKGNGLDDLGQRQPHEAGSSDSRGGDALPKLSGPFAKLFTGENRLSKRQRLLLIFSGTIAIIFAFGGLVNIVLRVRSEEHTSELQSLMRISYAVFCLKKK